MSLFKLFSVAIIMAWGFMGSSQAIVYPPGGYQDPSWAPPWFVECQGYKTWQDWSFPAVQPNPIPPDNEGWNWVFKDLGDAAVADLPNSHESARVVLGGGAVWQANWLGHVGVVGGPAPVSISAWVDNEVMDYTKQVWVQFDASVSGNAWAALQAGVSLAYPGVPALAPLTYSDIESTDWHTITAYWEIPQPEWEQVNISFNLAGQTLFIDNLKIATQCPEPATLGLLSAVGFLILRRGRRAKML